MKTVARTESCPPTVRAQKKGPCPKKERNKGEKMGPEAAGKCAPQKAGSPGRRKTSTLPRHRAYASWEDENKENIDPRTRKATATSLAKPKALSPAKTNTMRARRRRNAIVPVGSPRSVCDLSKAFAALTTRR